MEARAVAPIDLERPRDLGALLSAAFDLYGRFFGVYLGIAILVVIPTDLLFYGVLAGQLGGYDSNPDEVSTSIAALASAFIANPLITAMHVRAVEQVGKGQRPTLAETARAGFAVFGVLFATLLLYWVLVILGIIALIIPGIFLSIRWWVTPQVVVVEGTTGMGALRRAWELTQDNWWRIFGITLLSGIIVGVATGIFTVPAVLAAESAGSAPIELVAQIFADAIGYSFTALVGTLIFFDLRARKRLGPGWRDAMPGYGSPPGHPGPPPIGGWQQPPGGGGGYAPPPPGYRPPQPPSGGPESPEPPQGGPESPQPPGGWAPPQPPGPPPGQWEPPQPPGPPPGQWEPPQPPGPAPGQWEPPRPPGPPPGGSEPPQPPGPPPGGYRPPPPGYRPPPPEAPPEGQPPRDAD